MVLRLGDPQSQLLNLVSILHNISIETSPNDPANTGNYFYTYWRGNNVFIAYYKHHIQRFTSNPLERWTVTNTIDRITDNEYAIHKQNHTNSTKIKYTP